MSAQIDLKLEVVIVPVSDPERAKRFYEGLGWRMDGDFGDGRDFRLVQMTPPGSPCSIQFGKGITSAAPGSLQGTYLIVDDVQAARAELKARGADVSEVFHYAAGRGARVPGPDPNGRSYFSFATLSDPDGNSWLIQEIKTRLPGRGFSSVDAATLTGLLKEAEEHHGAYEPKAPKHHWSYFYGAYIAAREQGKTEEQAAEEGALNVERSLQSAHI